MDKEFIKYAEAFALKELGFNEPCIKEFHNQEILNNSTGEEISNSELIELYGEQDVISAPTFSKAFRWFRVNHNIDHSVMRMPIQIFKIQEENGTNHIKKYSWSTYDETSNPAGFGGYSDSHEEAELDCLRKIIEIVKTKQQSK